MLKKQKEKKKQETDGKRDKKTKLAETVVVNGVEPIKHYSGVEEHITYTNEPKGENLAHTTPKYGTLWHKKKIMPSKFEINI